MRSTNDIASAKRAYFKAAVCGVIVSVVVLASLHPAITQNETDSRAGEVAVGGKTILTIRVPSDGLSVRKRAEAINSRLVTILADPDIRPSDIVAVPLGRNAAKIMVKRQLLVTVDAQTARINQAKPLALAQAWVEHLRRVLPHVNVKTNPNVGEPTGPK